MADLLVTGTDTDVGKTIIAAALIKAFRMRGVRALGFKPAETGLEEGQLPDSDVLARASGEASPLATPLLQLAEPLAPAVAAERAGTAIHPDEIERRIDLLRRAGYTLVVEGAGGAMVPLAWTQGDRSPLYTVLDLAAHCGLEAVVVGRAGLGTLNHVTMTVAMLRARNVAVLAVVLNGREPKAIPDLAESTNPAALARMLPGVRIVEVPHHKRPDPVDETVPYVSQLVP